MYDETTEKQLLSRLVRNSKYILERDAKIVMRLTPDVFKEVLKTCVQQKRISTLTVCLPSGRVVTILEDDARATIHTTTSIDEAPSVASETTAKADIEEQKEVEEGQSEIEQKLLKYINKHPLVRVRDAMRGVRLPVRAFRSVLDECVRKEYVSAKTVLLPSGRTTTVLEALV